LLVSRDCDGEEDEELIGSRFERHAGDGGGHTGVFDAGKKGMACWKVLELYLGYSRAVGQRERDS